MDSRHDDIDARILRGLDRFHAAHPWDHNAHYHRWILRRLPRRFNRALDVGSGSGDLAKLLASRAEAVHGIDIDPRIVDRARELTDAAAPVTFTVGDALKEVPPGPYDVITCVATIHHMPFSDALTCFRQHLSPGGTLVVVGVYRPQSLSDGTNSVPSAERGELLAHRRESSTGLGVRQIGFIGQVLGRTCPCVQADRGDRQ
ncbi:class I SAM-dependent methyltransferase [Streptomyces sp. JV181]|nr:class I SAM-dependent methyltransferase [Streptomyces sp. JV181]